jgi:hypothetical protein
MTTPLVQRWEYLTLDAKTAYNTTKYYLNGEIKPELRNKPLAEVMNAIGGQGWEMVGIATDKDGHTYIFKRPSGRPPAARPAQPQPKPTEG